MAQQTQIAPGEFYHIYNRGTEKRTLFLDTQDHERFVILLYVCNSKDSLNVRIQSKNLDAILHRDRTDTLVHISAYCLMPNHFHVLIKEKESGNASKFMQKLSTGYSMYFNKRYERTGSLFQGTFKAEHVDNDRYLKYIISYIHLNPVKLIDPMWKEQGSRDRGETEVFLEAYKYSSFLDFCGKKRIENKIITPDVLPQYFENNTDFITQTYEWLSFKQDT